MFKGKNVRKFIVSYCCLFVLFFLIFFWLVKYNNQYINKTINEKVASIVSTVRDKYPNVSEEEIIDILNNNEKGNVELFSQYGIDVSNEDAIFNVNKKLNCFYLELVVLSAGLFFIMIICIFLYIKKENKKIDNIVKLIDDINHKIYSIGILESDEDNLSKLRSEIYKTSMMLKMDALESKRVKNSILKSVEDISHQLKTPLASISIMLDNILEDDNMDSRLRHDLLKKSQNQILSLNSLIVSLLQASRMDAGVIKFKRDNINVKELLNDVINLLDVNLELSCVKVNLNCSKKVNIFGDYKWEIEALKNILKNAIDASYENGDIDIIVKENNFYVSLKIVDHGVGIDKKDIRHIFERFYKVNDSNNSFGIGLNLAKMIIENDNGLIDVTSEKNVGTTFEIKYMK